MFSPSLNRKKKKKHIWPDGIKKKKSDGIVLCNQVQERARFRKRVEEIQLMMTSPDVQKQETADEQPLGNIQNALWDILDHEVLLKRVIAETVNTWNSRLQDIITAKKKEDKSFPSMPRRSILVPNTNTRMSCFSMTDTLIWCYKRY